MSTNQAWGDELRRASTEDWVNALDGVAYLAGSDGAIIAVGRERWGSLTGQVGAAHIAPDAIVGRSLFDMIDGDDVRNAFEAMHRRVATLARVILTYEYRCDAPGMKMLMKMSISALTSKGRLQGVLYQSTLLSAADRVPLEYLNNSERLREERRLADLPFVKICQFCAKVTLRAWDGEWVEPTAYYQRGGQNEVRLSHGICPTCEQTRLGPLLCD